MTSPLPELPVARAGPNSSGMMRSKVPCLLEEMFTVLVWKAICKYAFSISHDICGKTYFRLGLKKYGKEFEKEQTRVSEHVSGKTPNHFAVHVK